MALMALSACGTRAQDQAAPESATPIGQTRPTQAKTIAAASTAQTVTAPLRLVQTIPLPGVEGRIDHLAFDSDRQRLLVAGLGNNTLEIVDLKAGKRLATVGGLHEPQGVAYCHSTKRLYVANGASGRCEVYDSIAGGARPVLGAEVGDDADNARCDDGAGRIYIGYGSGGLAVLDATTGNVLSRIPLAGHPESFQLETKGPRIYINVPGAGHIAVVDRTRGSVSATWSTGDTRANFPMALDEAGHRLFVGCRQPARVLVYDTVSGKVVATLPIDGDTDDLFWDAATQRIYVSCGAGFIDAFQRGAGDHYDAIAHIATAAGARTSLFVPRLKRLYLAVPHRGAQAAEIRVYATSAGGG